MPGTLDACHEEDFTVDCLLQELLLALVGYTGDVFVDTSSAGEALDDLVRLGFHYRQLHRFMQQEQQPCSQRSLYRQALCAGLAEVLAVYEDEVVLLQEQVLQQGAERGLPGLKYQLAELQLHQLAFELRRRKLPVSDGGAAAAAAAAGAPAGEVLEVPPEARGAKAAVHAAWPQAEWPALLQACLQRLLWHVNQVLFNQLTMMVHGLLADEGNEFFIRPREAHKTAAAACSSSSSSRTTHARPAHCCQAERSRSEVETYKDWHEAFEVALHELPPGVTPHLATSVEFVGRAVRLLRAPPASAKLKQLQQSCSSFGRSARASSAGVAADQQQLLQQQWAALEQPQQQLLPHEDTLAFALALRVLQQQPVFSQAALERTVEAIRADVASRLWQLLVVQAGLMRHLGAVKDYLLLARGDFFQCFLADAAKLLAGVPREKTANDDLAVPWQSAAMKSTAQDDPGFKLFRLVLRPKPAAAGSAGGPARGLAVPSFDSNWDGLALEAELPWPLGVLLTPRHMERYNALFQLLLQLKRVQLALEQAWQELGRLCGRGGGGTSASDISPLLQLRQHMGHLISNLQIYLQLDVVESNYAKLQEKVAAAQDFAEAEHAHERFLHALVTQSFLSHQMLGNQFSQVFEQSSALCRLVRGARERGIDWQQVQSKTLQQYDKAPYLRQLYLRLDFNGYIRQQNMRMLQVHRTVATGYRQQLQQQEKQQGRQEKQHPGRQQAAM
ncbi:gamma-tubulin complex component protein [Scenedesmus sp. NREL 46B-D3]|nr:gamma-tubulin complex component protein [Scenedesmus sp. NREL 46B-D3]